MDNLTHSLAGLVTAEVIVQLRARSGRPVDPRFRRAAWLVSAAAHNAPDLDFVYTGITEAPLGYLLHHRGHTHTLALVPVMAALPYVLAWAWARRGPEAWWPRDRVWIALLALLGPIGHIALDLSNNYGVHPLWPLWNGWLAGDAVFIVEPLFWACTIPPILLATTPRWGRVAWAVILAIALALPWAAPFVPWPFALVTTVIGGATLAFARRLGDGGRAVLALGACLAVLATFLACGGVAESRYVAVLARERPGDVVLDVIRAPVPTVAPCWEMIAVSRSRTDGTYALRLARVSAFPSLVPVAMCSGAVRGPSSADAIGEHPERHFARDVLRTSDVWIVAELVAPIDDLQRVAARCDGAAYLEFARAPFVAREGGGIRLGDLRFDREPGLGFAELDLPADVPAVCPRFVPPWTPWRADLLAP